MEVSFIGFLKSIKKSEIFFINDLYCIFGSKVFPFFFINHIKKILYTYNIKTTFSISYEDLIQKSFFIHEKIIFNQYDNNIKEICFIIIINDKNQANKISSILSELSLQFYYIFFIVPYLLSHQKEIIWYNLEEILDYNYKEIIIDHFQKFLDNQKFKEVYFFLMYSYSSISIYASMEYLLRLLSYIPCIKKDNLQNFVTSYVNDMVFSYSSGNIFDLTTLFFRKKRDAFFSMWFLLKEQYSIEFWFYFWTDQIWYACLAVINQSYISEITYQKKVNRWFLRQGINHYSLENLVSLFHFLYQIDILHKKYNTSIAIDLNVFFIKWFK